MIEYLEFLLRAMRPAFSRRATFLWFAVVFAGFVTRADSYGVTSIVRALWLAPACYPSLLHFFHSTAWSVETLLLNWWGWLVKEKVACMIGGRIVLLGDHTKTVKDARKMPGVCTLHQDSETQSKPSFFRGHHWGCIGLLVGAGRKFFSAPLWAEIHKDSINESRATRIVNVATRIAGSMGCPAYLVLDAFFATGPVFQAAATSNGRLHILTRAKKNAVAYREPHKHKTPKRGRPRMYGKKLHLMSLFDKWADKFETVEANVYQNLEAVRSLTLDLFWKPIKRKSATAGKLRFLLIESSRGRIILMTSDLNIEAKDAINLYCRRATIETLFNSLKNLLGAMQYHFWSAYLKPSSRRPSKNKNKNDVSARPDKTKITLDAIEKFVAVQMIVLGAIQLLARRFGSEIKDKAQCWLRTPCGDTPSEFVTITALSNIIRSNLISFAKDLITQIILKKQNKVEITPHSTLSSRLVA